ncbi:hypothetical protein ADUPG1_011486 [Aduncisulcus paluster]|uniref:Uncharacterized protein n=1 Tax=Aduncisulcus paluster TaxID=2918883 RepID=A0ABQ5K071_9EUKA|nr:hypothetical protein ADUPG1_011486 [Aduncisulcus paluster]
MKFFPFVIVLILVIGSVFASPESNTISFAIINESEAYLDATECFIENFPSFGSLLDWYDNCHKDLFRSLIQSLECSADVLGIERSNLLRVIRYLKNVFPAAAFECASQGFDEDPFELIECVLGLDDISATLQEILNINEDFDIDELGQCFENFFFIEFENLVSDLKDLFGLFKASLQCFINPDIDLDYFDLEEIIYEISSLLVDAVENIPWDDIFDDLIYSVIDEHNDL